MPLRLNSYPPRFHPDAQIQGEKWTKGANLGESENTCNGQSLPHETRSAAQKTKGSTGQQSIFLFRAYTNT